ncbi:VaFE repeat-containing surface-anchored protein [Mediterraneibacter glycyrrhizinilyticus]|uniref:SpaA isopeptide-forming pilin-related protein n=1 Tax=Mediterraneibacter glycyrrhizinilyticus TaxID=342942 RepID=UPI001D071313|nr:SpaA isopeptide-forming pilin-related protein [Mediterraneibacter glycyrrhizinilyticus]MCB6308811.1 VaFE repeat-containing surface-anchored protein [Lachnospiraceae bacterium 210521-DFI.1.109]MCB6425790.1 VaFE repeat-containing surface-anchored protein [Mediterraneibacter glycyrrhizinilyticus]
MNRGKRWIRCAAAVLIVLLFLLASAVHAEEASGGTEMEKTQNESGRKTSDLERLFGPKEGEIDTRISATAWRNYLEKNQASFSGETYWSSHLQDTDIIIGSNYDDGTVVFQWNEGVIGINGQPTICIDAKTSFRDGIQYYPTDAQAVGLNETEVTRLALYQEYIYNQRSDLDDLGKYFFTQLLVWRELNEYYGWGWPNLHIFSGSASWTDLAFQEEVLTSAVNWVQEMERSGRYTGHGTFYVCEYWQAQAVLWLTENTGGLELYKESENPSVTEGNAAYSLEGAQYGVYRDGGDYVNPDAVITTDANGYGKAENLPVGEYWIKELVPPKGYALNPDWSESTVSVPGGQMGVYHAKDKAIHEPISVIVEKTDADQGEQPSEEQLKKLEGARFEVKYYAVDPAVYDSDPADSGIAPARTWVLETKYDKTYHQVLAKLEEAYLVSGDAFYKTASGESMLPLGIVTIRECKASNGYLLNETLYVRKIQEDGTDQETVTGEQVPVVANTPQKIQIEIQKVDSETDKGEAQGAAALKGAEYEVRDQAGNVVETLITDKKGYAKTKELPLGNYTVKETKASNGYLLDEKEYPIKGEAKDEENRVFLYKTKSKETVIRGDVELIKLRENENEDEDTLHGLEGVEFTFTSKTTGKTVAKIVTDKNGYATTASKEHPRGSLPFDTYLLEETKHPEGLKPIEPFEVTIQEEGIVWKGIYKEDKLIVSPITVVKMDASTGKKIPIKGVEFRLLDADKKPITMTTHYPSEVVHKTFKTDENGQFTFPEKLKYGVYYLEEVNAPEGYLKGELLQFEVKEGAVWNQPLVVKYFDKNAMGKIQIKKIDAETKEKLSGAVFEVRASEDIVTPDQTVRIKKGEVAETLIVGEDGTALSKELYIGKYEIQETKQPDGYVLDPKCYEVEIKYQDQNTPVVLTEISIPNEPTKVRLVKSEKGSETPLSGVTFHFWKKGEENEKREVTTEKDGTILLEQLLPGTYCFQEIRTLPGYILDPAVYEVVVEADGTINGEKEEILNVENDYTKVEFTKHDRASGKVLEDGRYQITDLSGNVVDEWKGKKTPHLTEKLLPGTEYIFKEIEAPSGYLVTEDVRFTVVNTEEIQKVRMEDENAMGKIRIVKTDRSTKERLNGAVFEIHAAEDIITPDGTVQLKKGELADTITTGIEIEDMEEKGAGIACSKELFFGKYVITEKKPPVGYVLDQQSYPIDLTYEDQDTPVVLKTLHLKNTSTELTILKQDAETKEPLSGVRFTVRDSAMPIENGNTSISAIQLWTTDENGEIHLRGLLPGTYWIQETMTVPGYMLDPVKYTIEVSEDGQITADGKSTDILRIQNKKTQLLGTKARSEKTGTQEAFPEKETVLIDTLEFRNLQIGQEYRIVGILMNRENGEVLHVDGKTVTAETCFVPEEKDGTAEVRFSFDATGLNGKSVVVFEKVYIGETEILSHEDLEDQEQTILFGVKMPAMKTEEKPESVKTGDDVWFLAAVLLTVVISGSMVVADLVYRRKRRK